MRLHDRYLFRELLTPLAYCLGGFLIFWISFFFFKEMETIQENKLDFFDTAQYCAASLPEFFLMVLPVLLLLALLYALTQHARHNEITALRAAGVSLWRLCAPYFIVGLVATGVYFALNELAVPRSEHWSEEILSRHGKKETHAKNKTQFFNGGFRNARANRVWQFAEYDTDRALMRNPNVSWTLPGGSWRVLQASRAIHTNGVWTFFDVQLLAQNGPHGNLVPTLSTNILAWPEFEETPERIRLQLKFADTQMLHASRNADIPLADLREYLRYNPGLTAADICALQTKFYGRLAAPWTCFVVVLIAIPFGAPAGRRNLFFGVAGSIFIGFTYFVLQSVSLAFGMSGQLPGWLAAWLPNFIFAIAGLIMTWRIR